MKQQNTIALCAIGRMENDYAREFVSHYLSLGFDHIYLYDNNRDGEERLSDVLGGFPAEKVTIIPWPNNDDSQRTAYNDCYHRFGKLYRWMAFFDFDEFLTIVSSEDIHTFMSRYLGHHCLLVNWMDYTDNGLVRNDRRPIQERFTQPMPFDKQVGGDYPENNHVKSIVRTGINGLAFQKNPHVPTVPALVCCQTTGRICKQRPRQPYEHSVAYLKHYPTKTIEEWLTIKWQRGVGDRSIERFRQNYADFFFKINERTPEKEAFIEKWSHRKGRVAAVALGRMGNQMFEVAAAMTFARRTGREFIGLVYNMTNKYDFDYPQGQFSTVMRNVKYIQPSDVSGFYHMKQGPYISNGFPDVKEPDVVLCDYYQDSTCIDRDIALQLFRPYPEILQEIQQTYGDLSDVVCVNVRRGDYLQVQRHGFRVLTKEQIKDMLDEHFPDARRVLFVSDDIPWCRQQFAAPSGFAAGVPAATPSATAPSGSAAGNKAVPASLRSLQGDSIAVIFADRPCRYKPEMDLYLQTQCGLGNIIANSSFSWWGAYLNEKGGKVVSPWPWFDSPKKPPMTHILPPQWIKHGNDYLLWVTYHKDELVADYGLHDDDHHRLFPVHRAPDSENINYLNPCWSEFVTLWYVWHNRIRSSCVGFCHYRRMLYVTRLPNKGECQVLKQIRFRQGETLRDQYARCHNLADFDLMLSLIDRRHGPGNPYSHYLRTSTTMLTNVCFLMSWQSFMQMGDFLFPLLDDFSQATGCGRDVQRWHDKAVADFGDEKAPYQQRLVGFIGERLVSAWIAINMKWYL